MKKELLTITALPFIILSAFLLSGCGDDGGLVLAKVDGAKIYAQDLDDIFERDRQTFLTFEEELQTRKDILDSLIIQQLLIGEAYNMNIDESEEVNRIVLGNKDRFLLDILYQRKVVDQVEVTEEEIKDYYTKMEYKVQASHILVDSEDTAMMLIDSLKNGVNFESLAVRFSKDPRAQTNRGDLGYFVWGQMDPVFLEQVFKMNPGEVSEPFETRFGWHIVKMVDRAPNELRSTYGKMADQIRRSVEGAERNERLDVYRAELEEKYPVRIDTVTCDYLMHKRAGLYPPSLLETLPKNDFDPAQLDRDEKELILASWDGGQLTVGQYLRTGRQARQERRPDFDDYDGLAAFVFQLNVMNILGLEARRIGLEDDPEYKRKLNKFKELAMADIMENDSIPHAGEPDEGEIRQYYEDNPDEFMTPAKVRLYEVMFNDYSTAENYSKKIGSLQRFKAIASEYTERSGKRATGGDLGWVEERQYPRLFKEAQELDAGQVSAPIAVGSKSSIIYVEDKKPEQVKDFLMVKDEIKNRLDRMRKRESFESWIEEKRAEASIRIYENNIRASINKAKYDTVDSTTG